MAEKKRILISGAGIAGLTSALWLERQGFDVTIVEKARSIRAGGFLISLSHHAYHYAEQLGIMPVLKQHDMGITHSSYHGPRGTELLALDYGKMFNRVDVIQMLRDDFNSVLYDETKNKADIRFGDPIETLSINGERADVKLTSGLEKSYDLVIGADGLHSVVRELVFNDSDIKKHYLDLCCAAFRLPNVLDLDNKFETHMERDQYMAAFSTGHGDIGAVFVWDSNRRTTPLRPERTAILDTTYQNSSSTIRKVIEHCPQKEAIYMDYLMQVEASSWSKGPVVLIGDAAHSLTLFSGRGAAAAFSGASRLALALQQQNSISTALQQYESEMRPVIQAIQPATRRAVRWYVPRNTLTQKLRDNGMRLLPNWLFRSYFQLKYSNI